MAAPFSVKELCKKRLITEMVEKVPGFKIMCGDTLGMKVLGSCVKVSDVTDLGIAVVEPVTPMGSRAAATGEDTTFKLFHTPASE